MKQPPASRAPILVELFTPSRAPELLHRISALTLLFHTTPCSPAIKYQSKLSRRWVYGIMALGGPRLRYMCSESDLLKPHMESNIVQTHLARFKPPSSCLEQ
jgi:hypothetical protein